MSPFALLFGAALLSPIVTHTRWLKGLSLLILAIAGFNLSLGEGVDLAYFAQTNAIRFVEGIVLMIAAAIVLHLDEEDHGTLTQLLFIVAASMALLESTTLLSFIITFEAISIISFVLVSNIKTEKQAEGAIKLFFTGATATGIILFGLALFTLSGHSIDVPLEAIYEPFALIALLVIFIGILYKLTIFPMHAWAADSYAQVNHTNAAILSALIKSIVAVATFHIVSPLLTQLNTPSIYGLATLAVITMTLGNMLALYQKNIARILAYSSIAHAGYMLIPFAAIASQFAHTGLVYLAIAYSFMQTAVFLILARLYKDSHIEILDDLKGLAQRNPLYALLLSVQLLSLAGIPLLAGFMSKAVAFYAGVDAGLWPFVLIALLNSALSVGYYAWIIKQMYFDAPTSEKRIPNQPSFVLGELILLAGTVYFGIVAIDIFKVIIIP
jgi:proton-translocating NADH-quinone oxidoreductase chain N